MAGWKFTNEDVRFTMFKKHDCPQCGSLLCCVKFSKVVNSKSSEAEEFDFSGEDGDMTGSVKFVWKEFICSNCKRQYTVKELQQIENGKVIFDNQIIRVNRGKGDNMENSIVYREKNGELHTIDLEICVKNYSNEHPETLRRCVGERNVTENYFLFYTSRVKTKLVFKRWYTFRNVGAGIFCRGTRVERFLQFQRYLGEIGYHTYDLT